MVSNTSVEYIRSNLMLKTLYDNRRIPAGGTPLNSLYHSIYMWSIGPILYPLWFLSLVEVSSSTFLFIITIAQDVRRAGGCFFVQCVSFHWVLKNICPIHFPKYGFRSEFPTQITRQPLVDLDCFQCLLLLGHFFQHQKMDIDFKTYVTCQGVAHWGTRKLLICHFWLKTHILLEDIYIWIVFSKQFGANFRKGIGICCD